MENPQKTGILALSHEPLDQIPGPDVHSDAEFNAESKKHNIRILSGRSRTSGAQKPKNSGIFFKSGHLAEWSKAEERSGVQNPLGVTFFKRCFNAF